MMTTCRICETRGAHKQYTVREMVFGTGEEFPYFECSNCGSLQIVEIPHDLARHYPPTYLGEPRAVSLLDVHAKPLSGLRRFLRRQRTAHMLGRHSPLGHIINKVAPDYFPYSWEWFRNARAVTSTRILDVGCGRGDLLKALLVNGFTNAIGQDPFQDCFLPGVTVVKQPLEDLAGEFELIMAHHSLEHMPDPLAATTHLKRLCVPSGTILLRVPVAGCRAWREYGPNWYQIDAPRHLVIPSETGLRLIAQRAQLRLTRIDYDSDETQFACSEQYRRGVPLKDQRSYFLHPDTAIFTEEQKRTFRDRARSANEHNEGDQACFYLTH